MNPFLMTDGYKTGHHLMYPENTTLVYSNFTPRSNKYAPKGCDTIVSFGQQLVMKYIKELFDEHFFDKSELKVTNEIKREYSLYLGTDYDVSHIIALHKLGYLPIKVKALPEGTEVPMRVPVLSIYNTKPEFYWLTNFLETLISNLLWKPMTSATIARQYKRNLTAWALKTDEKNIGFVEFQGHDFSMRGMDSPLATITSGLGHATSFLGSDSLPVIYGARKYYNEAGAVVHSVNATEHSVMCAGSKEGEIETFRRLMRTFPTGILSVVSDTWDLWKVLTEMLPILKDEILSRDGKLVIRPDSGDPVDIICGSLTIKDYTDIEYCKTLEDCGVYSEDGLNDKLTEETEHGECGADSISEVFKFEGNYYKCTAYPEWNRYDKQYYYIDGMTHTIEPFELSSKDKGVIELLWDIFGGTTNDQGYKILDPHIGAIYGDSITIDRAEKICERLAAKGFASTNIVLGVGSFTYQYNTRDTFGFAMKATYVEVSELVTDCGDVGSRACIDSCQGSCQRLESVGQEIFKDPITDDGIKKSAKGLLMVGQLGDGTYELHDQATWYEENKGSLQTIFEDGELKNEVSLSQIRQQLNNNY